MAEINKDIEKYISEVGTHLFCLKKNKKTVLADIREAVFEFTENNDVTSMDVIYERFGTPEEIAKAYIADAEPKNIKKAFSVRKVLVWAVVAVVLAFVIFLLSLFIESYRQGHGTVTIDIETGTTLLMVAMVTSG